jgi:hypothetical protein
VHLVENTRKPENPDYFYSFNRVYTEKEEFLGENKPWPSGKCLKTCTHENVISMLS